MINNKDIIKLEYLNNRFTIHWKMTNWCNYNCCYCIDKGKASHEFIKEDMIFKYAEKLRYIIEKRDLKDIELKLIGGEVTYYNIPKIIDIIGSSKITRLTIISNFSRDNSFFKELYLYCKYNNILLNLTLSRHYLNKEFDSKYLDLQNWMAKNQIYNFPKITMVVGSNFDFNIVRNLLDMGITNIDLSHERDKTGKLVELPEDIQSKLDLFSSNKNKRGGKSYSITLNDGNVVYFADNKEVRHNLDCGGLIVDDHLCNAGQYSLFLSPEGNLYPIDCRYAKHYALIGNILDENLDFTYKPINCKLSKIWESDRCILCNRNSVYKNVGK